MPQFPRKTPPPSIQYPIAQGYTSQTTLQAATSYGTFGEYKLTPVRNFYEKAEREDGYDLNKGINDLNSQPSSPSYRLVFRGEPNSGYINRKRSPLASEEGDSFIRVKRTKFSCPSTVALNLSVCSKLPVTLWTEIFSFLHPADLGRQRRTCKLFEKCLNDESIWRRSRKRYLPDYPKPVFGLAEREMLGIMWGSTCMLCENDAGKGLGSVRNTGPKATMAYWPFRVRCCRECLEKNSVKEFTLLSSTSFPVALLSALPFGIVDLRNNWISNPTHYQPNIGLTKVFWNADITDIVKRYGNATEIGIRKEWLKSLAAEGSSHKLDIIKIEKFETDEKTNPETEAGDTSETGGMIGSKQEKWLYGVVHQTHRDIKEQGYVSHSYQHQDKTGQHESAYIDYISTPVNFRPTNSQSRLAQQDLFEEAHPPQNNTLQDTVGMKTRCRDDNKTRCLLMVPSLKPELRLHIPDRQAAMNAVPPLEKHALKTLEIKLLEQFVHTKEQTCLNQVEWQGLQLQEGSKALEQKQNEYKERKEKEWDDFQVPVREKLGVYADEVISRWVGSITEHTAPQFAVDVLNHCRRRFYEENPYSADDPHHVNPINTTTRTGRATLEVPTTRRLTLENMKFVFDSKIRPSTDQFRRDLFLCNGCEYNARFYAFEGVIQHYAAKHTSQLSVGSTVVHWKTDWPVKPPFNSGPLEMITVSFQSPTTFGPSQAVIGDQKPSYPPFPETTSRQFSNRPVPIPTDLYTATVAYSPTMYAYCDYPSWGQRQVQHKVEKPKVIYQTHLVYLEQIAKGAREAWFQLSGIKDLPSSVRVHYVISRTIASFQARFSYEPPLPFYIETLKEYASLKPLKNANGLYCLECHKNPPPAPSNRISGIARLFTFSALAQHFQTMHVTRNRATIKPDWKTEMVKLPEMRLIRMLRQAQGMDEKKYELLKDVFAQAFSLPLPEMGSSEEVNHAVHMSASKGRTHRAAPLHYPTVPDEKAIDKRYKIKDHLQMASPIATATIERPDCQNPRSSNVRHSACRFIDPLTESKPQSPRDSFNQSISSTIARSEGYGYSTRPLSRMPRSTLRQDPTQSWVNKDRYTMNAAERFLENFLRNANDKLEKGPQESKVKELLQSPLRTLGKKYKPSLPSICAKYQDRTIEYSSESGPKSGCAPENRANLNKLCERSYRTAPATLLTDQHDRYGIPLSQRSMNKYNLNEFGPRKTTHDSGSQLTNSSLDLQEADKMSHFPSHDLPNDRPSAPSPIYFEEQYNVYSHARQNNTRRHEKYHPPRPDECYWDPRDCGSEYQDIHLFSKPPVVHLISPIPLAFLITSHCNTRYKIDYRESVISKDLLSSPLPPPTRSPHYLSPRLPAAGANSRHRSRSPAPAVGRSPKDIAMSHISISAPPPKNCGTVGDRRRLGDGNDDKGYYELGVINGRNLDESP